MTVLRLYALDFDGVLCDSAIETGVTGWKVARQIWRDMPEHVPDDMIALFRDVRPVMETGYEAILIMRLLFEGVEADILLNNFAAMIEKTIAKYKLQISNLKQQFGDTRDNWIASSMAQWIDMNPLFKGVAEKLRSLNVNDCMIITTKQERFVSQILAANDVDFPADQIFGLDRKMSKQDVLYQLLEKDTEQVILFVEDRLPTLHAVLADTRLKQVSCLFAGWGYNTQQDKADANNIAKIKTLKLHDFIAL